MRGLVRRIHVCGKRARRGWPGQARRSPAMTWQARAMTWQATLDLLQGALISDHGAVQIVGVGAVDPHRGDLAHAQWAAACNKYSPVDLRRIGTAAAFRGKAAGERRLTGMRAELVDDDGLSRAHLALEPARGDGLLPSHQPVPPLFLHVIGNGQGEIVRDGPADRLVTEAADPIELGHVEPIEQKLE